MLSYWKAYGGSYDFCRFFYLEYETGTGYMLLINDTLLICTEQALPADELILFIQMHLPFVSNVQHFSWNLSQKFQIIKSFAVQCLSWFHLHFQMTFKKQM